MHVQVFFSSDVLKYIIIVCVLPAIIQVSPVWVPLLSSEKTLKLQFVPIDKLFLHFQATFLDVQGRCVFTGMESKV